ncbi:MAG: hypothetical protein ACI35O_14185 [Bacillaceae bacterium]
MKTITLGTALSIRHVLTKRIRELIQERQNVATANVEKNEPLPPLVRDIATIEQELAKVRKDFRKLDYLMQKANVEHTITFENETYSITEAIEYAKQLRAEVEECKAFANMKEEVVNMYLSESVLYQKLYFQPEQYRLQAIELERKATRISGAIDEKNFTVIIPFDASDYY